MPNRHDPHPPGTGHAGARTPLGDLAETRVKTRRVVRPDRDVVYDAEIETSRITAGPEFVTETHYSGTLAACGCVIDTNLKPRFHRDGTMVCQNHYYFCGLCTRELLPPDIIIIEKRIYCSDCALGVIDRILEIENYEPGSFDNALIAHLIALGDQLYVPWWKRLSRRLFRRQLEP